MKDFNERKAEILRRANERIIRRKTIKNRILSIAIPFFVLGVALSIFLSGGFLAEKSKGVENTESYEEDFFANSTTDDFFTDSMPDWYIAEIKVSDNNGSLKKYTANSDSETIEQVTDIINSSFNTNSGGGAIESSTAAITAPNATDEEVKNQNSITEYKIETIDSLGKKTVFILKAYKLTNTETGETVTLNNAQRESLLNSFGLKENE